MTTYYLRIEGVNLSNFIDDTEDLSTIRGGSLLLREAVHLDVRFPKLQLKEISSGASAGLFQFEARDDGSAEETRQRIEQSLHADDHLKYATFVVSVLKATNNFVRDRETLLAANRWQQMGQPRLAVPTWNHQEGGFRFCQVDRVRPATATLERAEGKKESVSRSVKVRADHGRRQKQDFYARETGLKIDRDFAHDLDELTGLDVLHSLHHKMAVIYLDGNDFTTVQRNHCGSPSALSDFDRIVRGGRRRALTTILERMQHDTAWISGQGRYRFEVLLWGGDEMILVVPAWQGWKTLDLFYQGLRDMQVGGTALTHGGGLVLCHHSAPIHRITSLARRLASKAKDASRAQNLFAYEILESFDHPETELDNIRKARLPKGAEPKTLILPGESMKGLAVAFERVGRMLPRRQAFRLVDLLRDQPAAAEVSIKAMVATLDPKEWSQIQEYFSGTGSTMWVHLVELWDYLVNDVR